MQNNSSISKLAQNNVVAKNLISGFLEKFEPINKLKSNFEKRSELIPKFKNKFNRLFNNIDRNND